MGGFVFLMVLFAIFCAADIALAFKSFLRGGKKGNALGAACIGAAVVTASYTLSLFTKNHMAYSVLSSIYFSGIDVSLISLLVFNWYYVYPDREEIDLSHKLLCVYAAMDILVLLVNPFCEIVIGYKLNGAEIACFDYVMHPLYWVHVGYCYVLLCVVLMELIRKSRSAPRIYARQYIYSIFAILGVVAVNAAYLFIPNLFGVEHVDFSLLGYSLIAFSLYWFCFNYSTHGLLIHFHSWIFENIDQGLVLFDFDGKLLLHNRKAEQMLPATLFVDHLPVERFLAGCGVHLNGSTLKPNYSVQCFVNGCALRCDYSVHTDRKGQQLARLLVFSSVTTQFDLLTGFHTWTDFKENETNLLPINDGHQVVATVDINSLRDINSTYGHTVGDRALQCLSEEMRARFPHSSIFTRSREASLAVITDELTREETEQVIRQIQQNLKRSCPLGFPIQIQSSVSLRGRESAADTIRQSLQSMRTKKLMDKTSVHSEMLRSLLQALSQCDPDTGSHVQRTQRCGEELGRRINLSDSEQSHLALLAILHDIGKIGIPLEILNKPGKLDDDEWTMMKTHVEKGYQIAKSSKELSEIADMILSHHERWDGHGYPNGLRGEQIPLLARIIAVVDAYDAMTNDRSYRKALAESAARSELLRGAGSQFDPNIVREFLEMLEENDRLQGVVTTTMSQKESGATNEYGESLPVHLSSGSIRELRSSTYIMDSHQRITQVDSNFEALTGYSRGDVAEGTLTQLSLIFPEDLSAYQSCIRSDGRDVDLYLRHRLRRKDGSAIVVNCYGHDFYDSSVSTKRTRVVIVDCDDPFGDN